MRPSATALIVLALVAAPVLAQVRHASYGTAEDDEASAMLPLTVLVDTVPEVVETAITEAEFDTTPDDANQLVEVMNAFTANLTQDFVWPDKATPRSIRTESFRVAGEIMEVVTPIPLDIGTALRNLGRCEAWQGNATAQEVFAWAVDGWPALGRLSASVLSLRELPDELPGGVDGAPLVASADRVETWMLDILPRADDCLPPLNELTLRLIPNEMYPTGRVRAIGTGLNDTNTAALRLEAPSLGVSTGPNPTLNGAFQASFEVPADAELGEHTVTVTAGDQTASAVLTVVKAPARLLLTHPPRADPGSTVELTARVATPFAAGVGQGPLRATGGVSGEAPLQDRAGTFSFTMPDDSLAVVGRIHYDGSASVQAASAPFRIDVPGEGRAFHFEEDAAASLNEPPVPDQLQRRAVEEGFVQQVPFVPVIGLPFTDRGPAELARELVTQAQEDLWLWLLLLALLVAAAAYTWYRLRRRARAAGVTMRRLVKFQIVYDPRWKVPSFLTGGIVAGMATVHKWLRDLRIIKESTTAREMGDELGRRGAHPGPLVDAFERVRYGDEPEPRAGGVRERTMHLLKIFWERLRGVVGS